MSGEEITPKSLLEKYPFLSRNWFWILLAVLLIVGMYVTATYLWNLFKGGKKGGKTE